MQEDLPTDPAEVRVHTDELQGDEPTSAGSTTASAVRTPPPRLDGRVMRERYLLERRIGSGNMGQIYQAVDRRRQEAGDPQPRIALKIVHPDWQAHSQSREALHQEAMLARQLVHPNIVSIHDFDRDGDFSFLVMEWLDGESLARFLDLRQQRPVARPHALKIIEAIARALAHAHGLGIVHADIKPGNIFLCGDGEVKLLDFGVARSTRDGGSARMPMRGHTPEYASCEVLEGVVPGPVDDLFSLGCVAYRMLAGQRPFGQETALAAEAAGLRPAPIDYLPPQQWQALDKALAFRRADRHADVNQFIAALKGPRPEHFAETRQGTVPPEPATAPDTEQEPDEASWLPGDTWQPAGGLRGGLKLAGAAAGLALVAVLFLVWQRAPEAPALADTPVVNGTSQQPPTALAAIANDPVPGPMPVTGTETAPPPSAEEPEAIRPDPLPLLEVDPPARRAVPLATPVPRIVLESPVMPRPQPVAVPAPAPLPQSSPTRATPTVAAIDPSEPFVPMSALRLRRYAEPGFFAEAGPAPSGWVDVSFVVDTRGRPRNVQIVDALPVSIDQGAVIEAVTSWRFQPVAIQGEVTAVRSEVRLHFAPDQQAAGR